MRHIDAGRRKGGCEFGLGGRVGRVNSAFTVLEPVGEILRGDSCPLAVFVAEEAQMAALPDDIVELTE